MGLGSEDKQTFINFAFTNPNLTDILRALPELRVKDCWLVSGAVVQSVWNALSGTDSSYGIVDYDIVYFDPDMAWEAEDRVIRRGQALFDGLSAPVQIRNQARVHLWYERKYGRRALPLKSSCQSLWRYPSRTTAVALRIDDKGGVQLFSPFGVGHALNMTIQPNRRVRMSSIYKEKSQRWKRLWPSLKIVEW